MTDFAQGPGWWQASDGKWYPPELHPNYVPPSSPPVGPGMGPPPMGSAAMGSAAMGSATEGSGVEGHAPTEFPSYPTGVETPGPKKRTGLMIVGVLAVVLLMMVIGVGGLLVARGSSDDAGDTTEVEAAPGADGQDDPSNDDATHDDADGDGDAPSSPERGDDPEPDRDGDTRGTRADPIPVGEATTINIEGFGPGDASVWTLTVTGPGWDMSEAIAQANLYNDPPPEGSIFFGLPVSIRLEQADAEPVSPGFAMSFGFYGPDSLSIIDGSGSSDWCGVVPNEFEMWKEVFPGGSISGTFCFAMTNADVAGGVLLAVNDYMGSRIYFATE